MKEYKNKSIIVFMVHNVLHFVSTFITHITGVSHPAPSVIFLLFLTYITSTYESRPKMGHQMLILHVLINLSPKVKINKLTLTPG